MWSIISNIVLVILCCAYAECRQSSVRAPPKRLAAPIITDTKMHFPDTLTVFWEPIPENQVEKEHPVLGYKISLWLDNRVRMTMIKHGNRESGYEYRPQKVYNQVPNTTPTIKTVSSDQTSVNFTKIIPNIVYQLRVNAYNDHGDGVYSLPHTFKLLESEEERKDREDLKDLLSDESVF